MFFGGTVRAFTAQARIDRERDSDIRAAIAGYETGEVIPALASIVSEVIEVKRDDETVADALNRAEGTNQKFAVAVVASIKSQSPRVKQRVLVHRYIALGAALLASQVAGPAALYNVMTGGYNLPRTVVIVATVIFSLGIIGSGALAILVALGEAALAKVIREGKDAA